MKGFTNEDLKPGMFVVLKNGECGVLIPCYKYGTSQIVLTAVTPNERLCEARLYDVAKKVTGDYAIMRVYDLNEGNSASVFSKGMRKLLWEYKRNITIKEIEEILGYEIKIVEGE